jgi:hypothetical protein
MNIVAEKGAIKKTITTRSQRRERHSNGWANREKRASDWDCKPFPCARQDEPAQRSHIAIRTAGAIDRGVAVDFR